MFNPNPPITIVSPNSVWADSNFNLYTYSNIGTALRFVRYCSTGGTPEIAVLYLTRTLKIISKKASRIYQYGHQVVTSTTFGFSAEVFWATEDTLTFELIY